jgi:AcrR family transcriptional regulator
MAPTPRKGDIKFAERRAELGEAALQTLAELGYARTSLREIAQNSEFSHGVLHYYFTDKLDLILCSVRQYKARCVRRYDDVTATATSFDECWKASSRRWATPCARRRRCIVFGTTCEPNHCSKRRSASMWPRSTRAWSG